MAKRHLSSSRMCTATMALAAASATLSLLVASVVVHSRSKAVSFVSAHPGHRASGRVTRRLASTETVDTTTEVVGNEGLPPKEMRPGFTDAAEFNEGSSVAFFHSFNSANMDDSGESPLPTISDLTGPDSGYWLYHLGRTGFFSAQGVTALAISQLGPRMSDSQSASGGSLFETLTENIGGAARVILGEAFAAYRQDLKYIKQGSFKAPYDMSLKHRQFSPAYIADTSQRFFREAAKTVAASNARADTKTWVEGDLYPDYYKHTFHYQTDGWFSAESAEVYETSTETLFAGRQDAMQRSTLVHISRFMDRWHVEGLATKPGQSPRLLEVACGTGRVMTFVRDNWPSLDVTATDLSPFYLEKARENNEYWERNFAPAWIGKQMGKAQFVQANAEDLPFQDASFDAVVSVYLFHELPAEAQDNVFEEAARVLTPGGVFVLTDSTQLGDRPHNDETMGNFANLAEPYYKAYIRRDLAALARAHGLEPLDKELISSSKSLSFIKPRGNSEATAGAVPSYSTDAGSSL